MCKSASAVGEKKTSSGPGVREAVNVQPTCRQDEIDSLLFFLLLLAFSTHLTTLARSGPKQRVAFERLILNNPNFDANSFSLVCVLSRTLLWRLRERYLSGLYGNLTKFRLHLQYFRECDAKRCVN